MAFEMMVENFVCPSVFGFAKGEVVDSFEGPQSPDRVKQLVRALLSAGQEAEVVDEQKTQNEPTAAEFLVKGSKELEQQDNLAARQSFQQALRLSEIEAVSTEESGQMTAGTKKRLGEEQAQVYCGLCRCAIADGKVGTARQLLEVLKENLPDHMADRIVVVTLDAVSEAEQAIELKLDIDTV